MTLITTKDGNWVHFKGSAAEVLAGLVANKIPKDAVIGYTQYNVDTDAYTVLAYCRVQQSH